MDRQTRAQLIATRTGIAVAAALEESRRPSSTRSRRRAPGAREIVHHLANSDDVSRPPAFADYRRPGCDPAVR